jgi:hypothetical protein
MNFCSYLPVLSISNLAYRSGRPDRGMENKCAIQFLPQIIFGIYEKKARIFPVLASVLYFGIWVGGKILHK